MKNSIIVLLAVLTTSCSVNRTGSEISEEDDIHIFSVNNSGSGPWINLDFQKGDAFYYPLMAIWIEDMEGNFIQTIFVPKSVASSVFRFGKVADNKWEPGIRRYPQTLPYWAHRRGIKASDGLYMPDPENPIADAYSGATPTTSFNMVSRLDKPLTAPVKVFLEINQNWDWNEFWTNDLYPEDEYYKLSCQPAVVYETILDPAFSGRDAQMKLIGHSHHSGATGELFHDLSTMTTALNIADSIMVKIGR